MAKQQIIKIHFTPQGASICNTREREGGKQATRSLREFKSLPDSETCDKCRATIAKMERRA